MSPVPYPACHLELRSISTTSKAFRISACAAGESSCHTSPPARPTNEPNSQLSEVKDEYPLDPEGSPCSQRFGFTATSGSSSRYQIAPGWTTGSLSCGLRSTSMPCMQCPLAVNVLKCSYQRSGRVRAADVRKESPLPSGRQRNFDHLSRRRQWIHWFATRLTSLPSTT
jgi:hypothetical protein